MASARDCGPERVAVAAEAPIAAPAAPAVLALPGHFDRLAVGPDGRMVYLFAAGRTGFAVLDLARGRVVQGAGTESPVAEVAFLSDTAVLRLADQSAVGVMDLRTVTPGTEAIVGRVALGLEALDRLLEQRDRPCRVATLQQRVPAVVELAGALVALAGRARAALGLVVGGGVRGRLGRRVRAGHHGARPGRARPAVRALPQPRAHLDA